MTTNTSEKSVVEVKESIRAFILEYAAARGVTEVKDNEPLLNANIIDSLGSFRLIAFLEETFPLTIEDSDIVPENYRRPHCRRQPLPRFVQVPQIACPNLTQPPIWTPLPIG